MKNLRKKRHVKRCNWLDNRLECLKENRKMAKLLRNPKQKVKRRKRMRGVMMTLLMKILKMISCQMKITLHLLKR